MNPLPWYRMAATPVAVVALAAFACWRPNTRVHAALLGAALMSAFGVLMDQVSARLCPEYFTVLHNPIPGLTDPTLVGLVWGVLGAAGGGVALGYGAGLAATVGARPRLTTRELVLPTTVTVVGVAAAVTMSGVSVWHNAHGLGVRFDPAYGVAIPAERHGAALTVGCYHMVAYFAAVAGSVALCVWIGRERARRALTVPHATPLSAALPAG